MQHQTRMTAALLAAGGTLMTAIPADAGNGGPQVENARVRRGSAQFERNGNSLRIRASRNTIIDYSRFDIPVGTSVQFQQPDKASRVLNRINSDAPSMIMGSLMANGRVYFINRAGVVFGKDARIDVGALFAGAGEISNSDFLAGRDRMTNMRGAVSNAGVIRAGEVVLAGRTVVNEGTIDVAKGGLVALVSGDSVTLRRNGSNIGVRVAGGSAALNSGAGITNTGTVRAPGGRIIATAGDLASLAVDLEGSMIARMVEVDGGMGGVRIAGNIDATGTSNMSPKGGNVQVTGNSIQVADTARLDASGAKGGGTVLVGGDYQGKNAQVRNASTVDVAAGAQLRADATQNGDGGKVILWSDDLTSYRGDISARGAGSAGEGGFVEVSGKSALDFGGTASVLGSGLGANGTMLLDPVFFDVTNATDGLNQISIPTIAALLGTGNVVLSTSGDQSLGIDWNATAALSGLNVNSLTLNAALGGDVKFSAAPNFGTWTGDFNVNSPSGSITLNAAISRPLGGNLGFSASGPVNINTATVSTAKGNVIFLCPVFLFSNTTITAGLGGNAYFGSTVTGVGGNRNLTVNSAGTTSFMGNLSSIGQLTTNAGGNTVVGAGMSLAGNSTFNDDVSLTGGAHLISNTGAFNTTFGGTLTGPGALTVGSGTGLVRFIGSVGTGTALGGLTVNSLGNVTFDSAVNGAMALQLNTPGTSTFNGAVGGFTPLSSIDVTNGTTVVSGGLMSSTGAQNYKNLNMGALGMFNSGGNITIDGALSRSGAGIRDVTFNSPGVVSITGATTNIRDITSDAGGTFSLGGPMTLTGSLNVNDTLAVATPSLVIDASTGINLQDVTGNGRSLTLNSAGATVLNGNVTGINNFTTDAPGTVLLGGDVTGTGTLAINGAVTLAGLGPTRTLTTGGASSVTLGTVNGAKTLNVNGGLGFVQFSAIGGTTALDALNVITDGGVRFHGSINGATDLFIDAGGTTTFTAAVGNLNPLNFINVLGNVAFNNATVRTTGAQDYGNAVLGTNVTLTSTGGGDIHLHGTLDGTRTFISSTTGTTIFDGAVGMGSQLSTLTATAGDVQINGGAVRTNGAQNYGAVELGADAVLTSLSGGVMTFTSTVDGAHNLQVTSTGNTAFNGAVGAGTALTSLQVGRTTLNGNSVTTTGSQSYGTTTLGTNNVLTSTGGGPISFSSTINGARSLTVSTTGLTTFNGSVGNATAPTSLTVLGPVQVNTGTMRTLGAQSYGNMGLGSNVTFTSTGGGNVDFNGTVTGSAGQNMTVNTGGSTIFDGAVTGIGALTTNAAGDNQVNADITGSGAIALNGATNLGSGPITITSSGSTVAFGSTVNGAADLVVDAASTTTFNGVVGGTTALNSLFVGGDTVLNGGAVTTVGTQLYGDTTLGADTVLTSTGGGDITFKATVNGAQSLTSNTSVNTVFGGNVGDVVALTSINVPGAVKLNGNIYRTTGAQSYGDAEIGTDVLVSSTGGSDVTFNGTVDSAANESLVVNTSGVTAFNGTVSGLDTLETDAAGSNTVAGDITTTGNIALNGATSLLGALQAISSTGGSVNFGGTLDGAAGLTVNSTAGTTFDGAVGAGTALSSLTVNGGSIINGGSVLTTGAQSLGNTTLGASTNLTSLGNADIALGTVTGGNNFLGIHTGGDTTIAGSATGLTGLLTDGGGRTLLGGDVAATGDINMFDAVVLNAGAHSVTSSGGALNFGSSVDGPGGLAVNALLGTTFTGQVGAAPKLAFLTVNGNATFLGGLVWAIGDMNFNAPTIFGADTGLTAGGTLNVNANPNAGLFDLTINANQINFASGITVTGRHITLNGPAHGLGTLAFNASDVLEFRGDLTTDLGLDLGTPTLILLGGSIDALGDMALNSAVQVDGNRVITARNNGNVIFLSTVNGTTFEGDSLLVNSSGLTAFNAGVGGTMRMYELHTNQPGTIQVAPFANAVIVIYGELTPGPTPGPGGGVALAQALSSVSENLNALLGDGRRGGQIDYQRSMRTILTSALNSEIDNPTGIAGATGVAADTTEPE